MAVVLEETESKAALFEGGTSGKREEGTALFVAGGCCLVIQHRACSQHPASDTYQLWDLGKTCLTRVKCGQFLKVGCFLRKGLGNLQAPEY